MLKLLMDKPELQKLSPVAVETLGNKAVESITGANLGEYLPKYRKHTLRQRLQMLLE